MQAKTELVVATRMYKPVCILCRLCLSEMQVLSILHSANVGLVHAWFDSGLLNVDVKPKNILVKPRLALIERQFVCM
jgi:hypothetical protein